MHDGAVESGRAGQGLVRVDGRGRSGTTGQGRRRPVARALALTAVLAAAAALSGCEGCGGSGAATRTMLNVSYDPTREFYRQINERFEVRWNEEHGERVQVRMSHGGSGAQARAVIDGLRADVVTLALSADIDAIAAHGGLVDQGWQARLPYNSAPYYSTLVLLVRRGNPKGIHSWEDLAREGVEVITPNPKTSGVARWNYLALWGDALRRELGPDFVAQLSDPNAAERVDAAHQAAMAFVRAVFANVPVLDTGARAATNTFVQRGLGDVMINWENEILLSAHELDAAGVEMVIPAVSIRAEPVVAWVDRNVERNGTADLARVYLDYLYTPEAQELAARNFFRPSSAEVLSRFSEQFPSVQLFTIDEVFGGWPGANERHFRDGGTFDQIYRP